MTHVSCSFCGSTDVELKQKGLYIIDENQDVLSDMINMYECNCCNEFTYNDAKVPD